MFTQQSADAVWACADVARERKLSYPKQLVEMENSIRQTYYGFATGQIDAEHCAREVAEIIAAYTLRGNPIAIR